MEDFVEKSLLFDFYGELLTDRQKKIYQEIVFEDFSISEVAREEGISRQGVHDLMKRCGHLLDGYERKLHLVDRFLRVRTEVGKIRDLVQNGQTEDILQIAHTILEEL